MPRSIMRILSAFLVLLVLSVFSVHGLSLAKDVDHTPGTAPVPETTAKPVAGDNDNADTFKQLTLFSDVLERTRADYVDPVTDEKLIETAINGMLSALDPHSGYLNKKAFQEMQTQTRGEFGGLGLEVTMENSLVKVISPIDDTPAAKAGIQPNDLITFIDGKLVTELTLNEAVDRMRGAPGTKITLTLRRGGLDGKPFDVTLTRAVIHIQSVRWEQKDDVAYIRLTAFNEQTQPGLDKALAEADKQMGSKLNGYVLDLRNNPGGLLDQAVSVSGTFLADGAEVVSTRGRHSDENVTYTGKSGDKAHGKPVAVLINGGSASASEIVAGALQDHHRAILIGTKSFGKGSVQTIIPIAGAGAMRLTTARYYTPSGRSIQALGIEPDIMVQPAKLEEMVQGPGIHESDLRGALVNESAKAGKEDKASKDKAANDDDGDETPVASKTDEKSGNKASDKAGKKKEPFDYQLARAVDLIHGVHLFEAKATPVAESSKK